jgi:hypothetical protein
MRGILWTLLIVLLVLVLVLAAHVLLLGWAIGLGWVLARFLPFSLFEGTLLALIAAGIIAFFAQRLLASGAVPPPDYYYDEDDDEDDFWDELEAFEDDYKIPETRFYKTKADKTWEAWLHFEIANTIYDDLQLAPYSITRMGEQQLQELAIRLADVGIAVVKKKPGHTKQLKVTVTALRRQMTKMDQKPYDDEILRLAVQSINEALQYEETLEVFQENLWDERCEMFD